MPASPFPFTCSFDDPIPHFIHWSQKRHARKGDTMDRLRQLSAQSLKWTAIGLFVAAFIAVYIAQQTASPIDIIAIVFAIALGVGGFMIWLMYGERVDGGPRH